MSISSINTVSRCLLIVAMISGWACKREVVEEYRINDLTLYSSASEKKNLKTDQQFIAILYTDLFDENISNVEMKKLNRAYTAMGDKTLVIDLMIRSLLANSMAEIASENYMRAHPEDFIRETYKRFLIRQASEQEIWFLKDQIEKHAELKPIDVYYALLTSEEYRYY